MTNQIKATIKKILPRWIIRIYNYLPVITIVDSKTARLSNWMLKKNLQGEDHRGNCDNYLLRKYAHIVDKGLQNKFREKGRGKDIVVKLGDLLKKTKLNDPHLIQWSGDIYNDYYSFQKSGKISSKYDPPFNYIAHDYEKLTQIIKSRRSIRFFQNRKVDKKILSEIFEVVNWAPNSCNRQAIKLFVKINSSKEIAELMKLNNGATCMNIPPVFISVCFDTKGLILPLEKDVAFLDTGLGLQNLILLAHAKGLASCVLNWTHSSKKQEINLKKKLNIDDDHLVIANLVMGYPLKDAPTPIRDQNKEFIIWK